ncbi:MAG: 2-C-methyl-D-erythritol 2,4-cyclodiphosphate synthase [Spirochaetales bacterium]|nr:2-C-methyl-D-erythritol 2,4-cyclodiphosphate synthase [Spirochaetales bacterium]
MRIGQGWDIHRLESGRELILGGVLIDAPYGSVAHSDGDALTHAIIDAILGAIAAGDIGSHFPDTDPAYKDADSMELLSKTCKIISEAGFRIVNIDSTIILQKPKLKDYIIKIRERIAKTVGIEISLVSVKAKTNEGLGETGACKAVKTQAAVLLEEK